VIILISTSTFALEIDPDEGLPENQITGGLPDNVPNPTCVDNYEDWPNSTEYNANASWNLGVVPGEENINPNYHIKQFIDVNGDSLPDVLYSNKRGTTNPTNFNKGHECLLINNGNGWDTVYRCVTMILDDQIHYYGDCALIEEDE